MHMTVREEERLQIWAAAEMARRRLERGIALNYPEAVAVICDELLSGREGNEYADRHDGIRRHHSEEKGRHEGGARNDEDHPGGGLVPRRHEARNRDESNPQLILRQRTLTMAAQGKWSPPPIPKSVVPKEAFDVGEPEKCGAIDFGRSDIEINAGRPSKQIVMVNTGDRPDPDRRALSPCRMQPGHGFRSRCRFRHASQRPSGTAVRFEPGQSRKAQVTDLTPAGRPLSA